MEQYNGEPGALRGACPVLREVCADLPPKCGKAALSYSTPSITPIHYTSINTSYWQDHFLAFGRLPRP